MRVCECVHTGTWQGGPEEEELALIQTPPQWAGAPHRHLLPSGPEYPCTVLISAEDGCAVIPGVAPCPWGPLWPLCDGEAGLTRFLALGLWQ